MNRNKTSLTAISLIILLSLVLSACLSLSEDITPPPGNSQQGSLPATQAPRPTAAADQDQPSAAEPTVLGEGTVSVAVSDQTGGSLSPEDLEVWLEGFDQFELAYQAILPAGEGARAVFSDVPLEPGRVFFASVAYGGAIYRSEIIEVSEGTSSLELTVQIYATTSDDSGLVIDRLHILLEFLEPGLVNVVEIYIFSNLGGATVVAPAEGEPAVRYPLPAQAGSIEFDNGTLGDRYLLTEDGFGDTASIPPGSGVYQMLVYYTLPYRGSKLSFKQSLAYPVGAVVVMLSPAGEVQLKKSALEDLGIQTIPGGDVQIYSGGEIAFGQDLEFQVTGIPAALRGGGGSAVLPQAALIGIGAAGALLLLTGIALFLRNRREGIEALETVEDNDERELIMDSIIALDDLYQKGEISKTAYQQKRKELKEELSRLTGK